MDLNSCTRDSSQKRNETHTDMILHMLYFHAAHEFRCLSCSAVGTHHADHLLMPSAGYLH
jgi:hypothetical protein